MSTFKMEIQVACFHDERLNQPHGFFASAEFSFLSSRENGRSGSKMTRRYAHLKTESLRIVQRAKIFDLQETARASNGNESEPERP